MKRILIVMSLLVLVLGNKTQAADIYTAQATAYCLTGQTATGTYTRANHTVASKREWFGKVMILYEDTGDHRIHPENYIGTYVVEDTGGEPIQMGWVIDVYIPGYKEAKEFGRHDVVFQIVDSEG